MQNAEKTNFLIDSTDSYDSVESCVVEEIEEGLLQDVLCMWWDQHDRDSSASTRANFQRVKVIQGWLFLNRRLRWIDEHTHVTRKSCRRKTSLNIRSIMNLLSKTVYESSRIENEVASEIEMKMKKFSSIVELSKFEGEDAN